MKGICNGNIFVLWWGNLFIRNKSKRIKKEFTQLIQGINFIQIDDTNAEELISDLETPAFGFDKN